MKRATLLIVLAFVLSMAACVSSGPPPRDDREMPMMSELDLALPASWWHEAAIAEPLQLTGEQFQKLDALQQQQEDVARIERDSMVAARELREAIDAAHATAPDIVAAGSRLRAMRDTVLERQIALVAAEREILTREQWRQLRDELAEERRPRRGDREGERGRGRGPGGGWGGRGGGRRPF
jgi:Spy/CpxP family protein refolding chaperone